MKIKTLLSISIPIIGIALFFASPMWNSSCTTPPPPPSPPPNLDRWSKFLYESEDRDAMQKAARAILQANGVETNTGENIYNNLYLKRLLNENSIPSATAFISDPGFRDLVNRFENPKAYRQFMRGLENILVKMDSKQHALRKDPLFANFFQELKSKEIVAYTKQNEPENIFTDNDLLRYRQLEWFTSDFRNAAINEDWPLYSDHFRDSRRDSAISVLDYIESIEKLRENLFRSEPEYLLSEALLYIRKHFPVPNEDAS